MASDKARIRALFATDDLDELTWREPIDVVAPPGATMVDVVVTSKPRVLLPETHNVGLCYWPDGPVIRGVQTYKLGESRVFKNVPVKPGGVIALASSTSWDGYSLPASVSVERSGTGADVASDADGQDPTRKLWTYAGVGIVIALAIVALNISRR